MTPLSLTGKRWFPPSQIQRGDIVAALAAQRGIDLNACVSWDSLSDPMMLGDMQNAVKRIRLAVDPAHRCGVENRETVGIIGDYDADGITGVAQLVRLFRRHGIEPHVILPHREKHGYGVKREFIEAMHAKGVTLLITVDTGVTAVEEIAEARRLGMDVIVLDHHTMSERVPDAIIVHPNTRHDVNCQHLSGSGVAFTLIRALEMNDPAAAKRSEAGWADRNVDVALAAIGTVADVVPLLGENRAIVQLGLESMNNGGNSPVFDLANMVKGEGERLTSAHIGFRIAPRINAAGRIADPYTALQALLEGGGALHELHAFNEERQDAMERMYGEAEAMVDLSYPVLMIKSETFHHGIIGLIAGKLTERHGRPSVVGVEKNGTITCSLRSIPRYHITNALRRAKRHLLGFGGHAAAAGCTLEHGRWRAFVGALCDDARTVLDPDDLIPTITIDAILEEDVRSGGPAFQHTSTLKSLDIARALQQLEPFGAGNPEPRFLLQNRKLSGARLVGKEKRHLQCRVGPLKAIGFGLGHLLNDLPARLTVGQGQADVVCRLGIDHWDGSERAQLFIEDVAAACLPAGTARVVPSRMTVGQVGGEGRYA